MPRTTHRLTAILASVGLAISGTVAAGTTASAAGSTPGPVSIRDGAGGAAINAPGTLMFIKDYNVWMSRGDGSGQVQITTDGYQSSPYSSPVMDDKGTVAALRGNNVIRMKTDGTPLSVVDVGTLLPIAEGGIQATSGVALSPDGSKIAYDQTSWKIGQSVNVGTRFSASDRWTSAGEQELSRSGPKWITNSRVITRAWSTLYLRDLASSTSVEWFEYDDVWSDPDCDFLCFSQELYDPEVSRDGTRLVTMVGPLEDAHLATFTVSGNVKTSVPSVPTLTCLFHGGGDEEFSVPTIAPDNKAMAWQMSDGIWAMSNLVDCDLPNLGLVVAGGSEPSWSAAAYTAPPAPKPDPQPGDKIVSTKVPAVSGKARVGKTLKATKGSWTPAPSKLAYQWKRNGKAIKGATKAKYKLKKADAGKKVTVTVTATRASYKKASATSKAVGVAVLNTKKPAIKKKPAAKVGKTLKVTKGKWKGKTTSLSYQWYRGKKKIKGATKARYKLTKADKGKRLRVKVTAKRTGAPNVSVYTAKTKKVR